MYGNVYEWCQDEYDFGEVDEFFIYEDIVFMKNDDVNWEVILNIVN